MPYTSRHMETDVRLEIVGWIGAAALLVGFILVVTGSLAPASLAYGVINFFGSLAIVAVSLSRKNWQPAALNVIWAGVALYHIVKATMSAA